MADVNRDLGLTVLIITHQMEVIARLCDDVAVLEGGRLIETGAVDRLFTKPEKQLTTSFIETVLPFQLDQELQTQVANGEHGTVVRINHTGKAARNLVSQLAHNDGVDVAVLHSATTHLRGTSTGVQVLGLTGPRDQVSRALGGIDISDELTLEVLHA